MRDSRAVWRLGARAVHIDVNPLVVSRGIGKARDPVLRHLDPVTDACFLSNQRLQLIDSTDYAHGSPPGHHGRLADTQCTNLSASAWPSSCLSAGAPTRTTIRVSWWR